MMKILSFDKFFCDQVVKSSSSNYGSPIGVGCVSVQVE